MYTPTHTHGAIIHDVVASFSEASKEPEGPKRLQEEVQKLTVRRTSDEFYRKLRLLVCEPHNQRLKEAMTYWHPQAVK